MLETTPISSANVLLSLNITSSSSMYINIPIVSRPISMLAIGVSECWPGDPLESVDQRLGLLQDLDRQEVSLVC